MSQIDPICGPHSHDDGSGPESKSVKVPRIAAVTSRRGPS